MEKYLHLLMEQMDKNLQINELAKRTRDAIAKGDMASVMESDAVRKEIVSRLKALQLEMAPYFKDLPDKIEKKSPELKEQILTVSNQLYYVVNETIAIDRENEIQLRELKDAIGGKIKEVSKGKKALTGYRSASQNKPKLFDGEI